MRSGTAGRGNGGGHDKRGVTSVGGGCNMGPVGQMGAGEMFTSFKMKDSVCCVDFGNAEGAIMASLVNVARLCAIGGGAISSTSESLLIIVYSIPSLFKALLLALGMSALDGLPSDLHAYNRVKKASDSLPIILCNLGCSPPACMRVSPVLVRLLV